MRSLRLVGLALLGLVFPLAAQAATSVPEIDPGSAVAALSLVAGSVVVLSGRARSKR